MKNVTNGQHARLSRPVVAAGLVVGAAAGAWVGRRVLPKSVARTSRSMIDWEQARSIAVSMNRGETMTVARRAQLDAYYRDLVEKCLPLVARYTGDELQFGPDRTFAFDRVDWVNANITAFQSLFAPIESMYQDEGGERTVVAAALGSVNRRVISTELGLLLGYLARRVLGQYDLALLGREPVTSGKLYFVEPNIRATAEALDLPKDDFRMWLALHETTHAFEFEAHPWVRIHFNELLESYMGFLKQDAEALKQGLRGLRVFAQRARTRDQGESSWIEAIMSPDQRALFNRMQALMCVIEGYSNHVMNAVGHDLLPSYELIAARFERRKRQRTPAEQLFARLIGLDVKMEQYRLGEAFVNHVVAARGVPVIAAMWSGPDAVPSMDEIRDPDRWLCRVAPVSPDILASPVAAPIVIELGRSDAAGI